MNAFILIFCMVVSCVAAFGFIPFPSSQAATASNVCIYTADPEKYKAKCFPCLNSVYPSALQACVNGTTMPSNITYQSAKCLESNCDINYPTPAPLKAKNMPVFELLKGFRDLLSPPKTKRSIQDRSVQSVDPKQPFDIASLPIVKHVKTFASDMDLFKEMDVEYEMMS